MLMSLKCRPCWYLLLAMEIIMTITSALPDDTDDDDDNGDDWNQLEISPNVIGSVPYRNYRINVYEHATNNHNKAVTAGDEGSNSKRF